MSNYSNVILVFTSNWCNPCRVSKKYLVDYHEEDSDKYLVIDVTEKEELAYQYKIKNIPAFVLIDKQGKEVERFVGFNKDKIDNILTKVT